MKKILTLLATVSAAFSTQAFAVCTLVGTGITSMVTFPPVITVPSTAAIGSVIATGNTPPLTSGRYGSCAGGGTSTHRVMPLGAATEANNVYSTQLAGVGMRVTALLAPGVNPGVNQVLNYLNVWSTNLFVTMNPGGSYRVELIKTGAITSGIALPGGVISQSTFDSGDVSIRISSTAVQIREAGDCSVSTPDIAVDFGTFGPTSFTDATGPARPINFSVSCKGDTVSSVTATLTAAPSSDNANYIDSRRKNGLAVRLTETASGKLLVPNSLTTSLSKFVTPTAPANFALTGTVMKVGATAPTAGAFSTLGTLNLTYN
jgi:hypothetical protein